MHKGFTLAEVLITLMIIGIVAALTIPSVISNYQQQEFKTGLKKAVSVLNEAIQINIAQEGETPYENSNLFTYLQRHMNIMKTDRLDTCYNGSELVDTNEPGMQRQCEQAPNEYNRTNNVFYTVDGMRFEVPYYDSDNHPSGFHHYYLHESGVDILGEYRPDFETCYPFGCIMNKTLSGHCGSYGLGDNKNKTTQPPCILIVDVNGDKKPNPPHSFVTDGKGSETFANGDVITWTIRANQNFEYSYPKPTDKKLTDVFSIMVTDEKAIPFGVVAQRAMYSK